MSITASSASTLKVPDRVAKQAAGQSSSSGTFIQFSARVADRLCWPFAGTEGSLQPTQYLQAAKLALWSLNGTWAVPAANNLLDRDMHACYPSAS